MKLLGSILLLFLLLRLVAWPAISQAQTVSRAAVVVRFNDETVASRCVAFNEAQLSGYELLLRSGLVVESQVAAMGVAVCRVADTGCPATDCFCHCRGGGSCEYWSYWHQLENSWQYARAGAGSYPVRAGAVQGWSWGPGTVNEAIAPPPITFAEVCGEDAGEALAPAVLNDLTVENRHETAVPGSAPIAPTVQTSDPATSGRFSYLVLVLILVGFAALFLAGRRARE
jgi:hypothetical protein